MPRWWTCLWWLVGIGIVAVFVVYAAMEGMG
jgi:hypothetical protein